MPDKIDPSHADLSSVLFNAGQVVGLATRCSAEAYARAAKAWDLHPEYQRHLRLLAEFVAKLNSTEG